jgi:antitoxin component of MazEF toxin-antitoxin module
MNKRLTRTGNSLALVLDKPLLDTLQIDAETELEISTDGRVIIIAPVRTAARSRKLKHAVDHAHARYGGVFKRLAE